VSNIFVRIIGEFKDKEFKRAQKSTFGLTKQFDGLRRSARRAFLTVAGVAALKRSVQAFAEEDAAVQKLSKSLDNLGLRFEAGGIDNYLENLEKTVAVTKEQLYPAFQQLANTTLSVTKSQELLNAALDISAGTGKDLTSVVVALSRAFNGNFASLGKLQTSYTTAQLQTMGFNDAVSALSNQFSGSALTAANTYQGKIQQMNIAFDDAAEAIGEGVVDALTALGGGNYQKGLDTIAAAGERIGDAFRGAAKFIMVAKFALTGGLFKTRQDIEAFALAVNSAFAPPDAAKQRTFMRERAKYLKDERKQTEKIRSEREKSSKLLEKEKNNQKIIAEAQKKFDMERIQIEAALQGKINDVEEYRLKLQRAILNENVDNVVKYTGLLQQAEAQAAELADLLARLPEMAENPFTDWPATIARIQYLLKQLDFQVPIEVLFAEKGLQLDQKNMSVAKLETMNVSATNVYLNGAVANNQASAGIPWAGMDTSTPAGMLAAADVAVRDAFAAEQESLVAEAEVEAILAALDADQAELDAMLALLESGAIFDSEPSTTVNVTVEGSVITDQDLAEVIRNESFQYQRSGGLVVFNQVAI
jgi:hypothetical protein